LAPHAWRWIANSSKKDSARKREAEEKQRILDEEKSRKAE
jgi:hypothetical protein